jgi:hypothetical protein
MMDWPLYAVVALLLIVLVVDWLGVFRPDRAVPIAKEDLGFQEAVAAAKSTLPEFWQLLRTDTDDDALTALKVAFDFGNENREHV